MLENVIKILWNKKLLRSLSLSFTIFISHVRYKYYLAFENSVCLDYISEKTYKPYLAKAIPILMGGGQFNRVLPPNSYIDVMDFDSPKALAEYLKYLDQNEDKYMEYFWWWKYYEWVRQTDFICSLIKMA